MNRDADTTQRFLEWLLRTPTSDQPLEPSGEGFRTPTGADESTGLDEVLDQKVKPVTQHIAETPNVMLTNLSQPNPVSSAPLEGEDALSFEFGEMFAVQDRFYALLKNRLRAEIERRPPLFPWENEIRDYEPEAITWEPALLPVSSWLQQIKERLPVPMPDQLLASLYSHCQDVVHGSLQQGTKLVQSVESLFPGEEEMLNHLASLVLKPSFRDGRDRFQTNGFPAHYDVANPVQQMALSLIAASEILDSLTCGVSATRPQAQRQWSTSAGDIQVTVHYQAHPTPRLRIEADSPCASQLTVQGSTGNATTHRDAPGCMSVELFDVSPAQPYRLTLTLADRSEPPFVFSIQVET